MADDHRDTKVTETTAKIVASYLRHNTVVALNVFDWHVPCTLAPNVVPPLGAASPVPPVDAPSEANSDPRPTVELA